MMRWSKTVLTMAVGHRRHLLRAAFVLAALAAGLWAWAAGLTGPYQFDDYVTPLNDPASQSLAAWREYLPVTLRPATKLTYALEADAGWSGQPAPRRAVSIVLQPATAALFVLLILRLSPGTPPLAAAILAALWFIHPVHADSVLMLSGRPAVLSGLFLLVSLLALERARPRRRTASGGKCVVSPAPQKETPPKRGPVSMDGATRFAVSTERCPPSALRSARRH